MTEGFLDLKKSVSFKILKKIFFILRGKESGRTKFLGLHKHIIAFFLCYTVPMLLTTIYFLSQKGGGLFLYVTMMYFFHTKGLALASLFSICLLHKFIDQKPLRFFLLFAATFLTYAILISSAPLEDILFGNADILNWRALKFAGKYLGMMGIYVLGVSLWLRTDSR